MKKVKEAKKVNVRSNRVLKQIGFFLFILLISFGVVYYLSSYVHLFSFHKLGETPSDKGNQTINAPNNQTPQNFGGNESSEESEMSQIPPGDESTQAESSGNQNKLTPEKNKTIFVASWNLFPLDDVKASDNGLMQDYSSIIDDYDIVFIQGITSNSAFTKLCELLPNYNCRASSMAGGNLTPEQYGVFYRKGDISLSEWRDYNPDASDRWKQPPIEVLFTISGYYFRVYSLHTNPDDVQRELGYLEGIVAENGNMIVLGDLNADCTHYNPSAKTEFVDWYWIITDARDTTVSSDNCAYDRIILNSEAYSEFMPYERADGGVYTPGIGITQAVSDHYLVWAEIRPEEQS